MKAYEEKFHYLCRRQNYVCPIGKERGRFLHPTDLHHARIHNTKRARAKYPLFIDSVANLVAVENGFHLANPSWGKWPEMKVAQYERFLERHPKIAHWLNNP